MGETDSVWYDELGHRSLTRSSLITLSHSILTFVNYYLFLPVCVFNFPLCFFRYCRRVPVRLSRSASINSDTADGIAAPSQIQRTFLAECWTLVRHFFQLLFLQNKLFIKQNIYLLHNKFIRPNQKHVAFDSTLLSKTTVQSTV